jgi:non-canonical (house-cleaning) NTP pyrophosphatase
MIEVVVASESPIKIRAVRAAFVRMHASGVIEHEASVRGCSVPSDVDEQPVGDHAILEGASNRLTAVLRLVAAPTWTAPPPDYVISVENGLVDHTVLGSTHHYDVGWVLVADCATNDVTSAPSAGVEIPKAVVEEASRDDAVTVGHVIARKTGCHHSDPHEELTAAVTTRVRLLTEAIGVAVGVSIRK